VRLKSPKCAKDKIAGLTMKVYSGWRRHFDTSAQLVACWNEFTPVSAVHRLRYIDPQSRYSLLERPDMSALWGFQ